MDHPLNQKSGLPRAALCFAVLLAPTFAAAQALIDPTRPPASLAAPGAAAGTEAPPASPLQSVMISGRKRSAMINGEVVKLHGKVGSATLVRVAHGEATLKHPDGSLEVLRMYPEVEIVPRTRRTPPATGTAKTGP